MFRRDYPVELSLTLLQGAATDSFANWRGLFSDWRRVGVKAEDQVTVWIGTARGGRVKAVRSERHRNIVSVVVRYPPTTFTIIATLVVS